MLDVGYLGEDHVGHGQDGLDAAKEVPLVVVAERAEFLQRPRVHVVNGAQRHEELALGVHQVLRQPKAHVHLCNIQ